MNLFLVQQENLLFCDRTADSDINHVSVSAHWEQGQVTNFSYKCSSSPLPKRMLAPSHLLHRCDLDTLRSCTAPK